MPAISIIGNYSYTDERAINKTVTTPNSAYNIPYIIS